MTKAEKALHANCGKAALNRAALQPATPTGPKTAKVGQVFICDVAPRGVPPTKYHYWQWDINGLLGKWVFGGLSQKMSFKSKGVKKIRAREKCPLGVYTSSWSKPLAVTII